MTTHQVAVLLDHLRLGLGPSLDPSAARELQEVVAAFRELPDMPLRQLLARAGAGPADGPQPPRADDPASLVERIRAARTGTIADEEREGLLAQVETLSNGELKAALLALGEKTTTRTADNRDRIKRLLRQPPTQDTAALPRPGVDPAQVAEGVRIYTHLRDTRDLTIAALRDGFEPLRAYPKAAIEEISRNVGHTPSGSKDAILRYLLSNLENLKISQQLADRILSAG